MATMTTSQSVDTRLTLRAYAALVGVTGFVLAGWGSAWLGVHLAELRWGLAALVRMCGAVLIGVAMCAAGLAAADPRARQRMLSWFIAAHIAVWLMLIVQIGGPLGDVRPFRHLASVMLAVILGLLYVRFPGEWRRGRPLSTVDGTERSMDEPSYGVYEQEIREAAAQEERNRLARDLHDAVKQQIFAIQTSAATAEARLGSDAAGTRDAIAQIRQSAREAMTEMEALLDQLRIAPLGTTGLVEAIRQQCEALAFRTGAEVEVQIGDLPHPDALEPGTHQAIYRIVQEALANVGRHARARHVHVSLRSVPGRLELTVEDDGQGFDKERMAGGMGMQNMRSRASEVGGSIEIRSIEGAGTTVTLSVLVETQEVRQYRRRNALALTILLGAGNVALAVDLLENGPGLGSVTIVVFALLFAKHARTWWRLRDVDRPPAASKEQAP